MELSIPHSVKYNKDPILLWGKNFRFNFEWKHFRQTDGAAMEVFYVQPRQKCFWICNSQFVDFGLIKVWCILTKNILSLLSLTWILPIQTLCFLQRMERQPFAYFRYSIRQT